MKRLIINAPIIVLLICTVVAMPGHDDMIRHVSGMSEKPTVVIDPGHGGIDGGAQSDDGTSEKDINLEISSRLKDLLQAEGIRVVMTRDADEGLYTDDGNSSIRTLKTHDMHQRKAMIEKADADLTVSIHLNSFTQDPSVKGAQVFYSTGGDETISENSKLAAEIMQEGLNKNVNTDKKRSALGKEDVFLLRDPVSPIVIAECGFLSNKEDLGNLKKAEHQEKISKTLKASICKYFVENGNKTQ